MVFNSALEVRVMKAHQGNERRKLLLVLSMNLLSSQAFALFMMCILDSQVPRRKDRV